MANNKDKLFGIIDLDARFELTQFKWIRALCKSRWFYMGLLFFNLFMFTIILTSFFAGGFSAGNYNFGIMVVWILWWVLLMLLLVPVFSRAWCTMCPFPLFSDYFQRGKLYQVVQGKLGGLNLKLPKSLQNMWIMNILFLFTTFFSSFMTVRPFASFIVIGSIIVLAFIVGLIFQKRTFCLYMCPVSGFQGLYAQFAISEVRCKDPEICKNHKPKTCFVGDENGYGCPWLLTPFDFKKNTYCGMCLECFKSCPYDNMAFNLRPPGVDLLVKTKREYRRLDEAWKAFIMLGIAIMFFVTFQGPWGALKDMAKATTWSGYFTFIGFHSAVSLVIFPAIFLIFSLMSKALSGNKEVPLERVFTDFAYTLIPTGLGVWIAFSIGIILPNGSYILHILSDPFAWGWDLFGTAHIAWTPVLTLYTGHLQGIAVAVFFLFAAAYGSRISRQVYSNEKEAKLGWLPILVYLVLLNVAFLLLFLG